MSKVLLDTPINRLRICRHGPMLYNPMDRYIGASFDRYWEFSEGEVALFQQLISPGQVVFDVGANIGAHTIVFARLVGPSGRVYAFEPQRVIFQNLCANLSLNALLNVDARQVACSDEGGVIFTPAVNYASAGSFGSISLSEDPTAGEIVGKITLDSLCPDGCNFIKIDVEGMEERALRGAASIIARFKPILYAENDRREQSPALIRYLLDLGYNLFWHTPALFNKKNMAGDRVNEFPTLASFNILGVHNSQSIPQIASQLPAILSPNVDFEHMPLLEVDV